MSNQKLDPYKKALKTFDEAMTKPPENLLERDGIILRFRYCLELSWKSAKNILEQQGLQIDTPKNVIRELAHIGWINNPEDWIEFIEAKDKSSYIYHEEVAAEIFKLVPLFHKSSHELLDVLEKKTKYQC